MTTPQVIPDRFVWTKMQATAGEPIENILHRKELERKAGKGNFWWGVGESKGAAVERLVGSCSNPEVLFSKMLSTPAKQDSDPDDVAVWQAYDTGGGGECTIPSHVIVTSGAHTSSGALKHRFYAIVCHARRPLHKTGGGRLNARDLRNIGGKSVGPSQVTAVVQREGKDKGEAAYGIDARAELARPYFATVVRPRILTSGERQLLVAIGDDHQATVDDWLAVVRAIRDFD